jgi:L-ascorbate peroxidase
MKFSLTLFAAVAAAASVADAFVQRPAMTSAGRRTTSELFVAADTLKGAQAMIDGIIDEKNCNPVFVRLAWHDSGTYDVNIKEWPRCGGAIGSVRMKPEITHGANKGLAAAADLLECVKEAFPDMSYADILQMASARSIELAGGPKIDMKYVTIHPSIGLFVSIATR